MLLSPEMQEKLPEFVNEEKNPVKYLSIDPGGSNGICGYDSKYYMMFKFTVPAPATVLFFEIFKKIEACVVETYNLFPNKAKDQSYSDMETSRVIGRIESWAERHSVQVIKQGANVKNTGYKWVGVKPLPKSNPNNHELDAHIHFIYWAVKSGRIKAQDLIRDDGRYLLPK